MKKVICVAVVLLCTNLIFGQLADVKWGKPFSKKIINNSFRVLRINNDGLTLMFPTPAFMKSSTSISVVRFDRDLNYVILNKFALKYQDQALDYEFTVPLNGRTLVFSSNVDNKAGKKTLYCNEFNDDALSLSSTTVKITEEPIVKAPMPIAGGFDFSVSPDSGMVALIYSPPVSKDGMEAFGFIVLDKDLKQVYNKKHTFPFKDNKFHLGSAAVSPAGRIFLCGYLTSGPKNPFKSEPNYKYVILTIDQDLDTPLTLDVDLEGKFIPDMRIVSDYNGDLIGAGFFSEAGNFSIKGCFSVKIDGETGSIINKYSKDFTIEFITAGMKEKQATRVENKAEKGKNVEMENYNLDYLKLRPDNGIYLIAERFYSITTYSTNSQGQSTSHTTYYAEDIIVVGMNSEAEIDVVQKVLKKQKASSPTLISYTLGMKGSTLYFVFTDHALNNAPKPPYTEWATFSATNGVTTIASVNADGALTRKKLMSFDQNKFYLWPGGGEILKNGDLLLVTLKASKAQLGLLSFE